MQAVTRNALASPSIFGINAGASLAVVCLTVMFPALAAPQTAMGAAFAGGAAVRADRVRGCLSIQRT
nr:iron chelate uptake ABC transporter family permease subunit [Bacillus licheniformis]